MRMVSDKLEVAVAHTSSGSKRTVWIPEENVLPDTPLNRAIIDRQTNNTQNYSNFSLSEDLVIARCWWLFL